RACAAFFKRTKIAGRSYLCRQGDGKCVFRKHERFMCRSCRFDKCVTFGLQYDNPRKRKTRAELDAEKESSLSTEERGGGTERAPVGTDDTESALDQSAASTSTFSPSLSTSLLDAVALAYQKFFERRLAHERQIVAKHRLRYFHHPTETFYTSSVKSYFEVFQMTIEESVPLFQHLCEGLGPLTVDQKATLFKGFLGRYYMAEGAILSAKYYKGDNKFMTSLITCVDGDHLEEWVELGDNIERVDDFLSVLKGYGKAYTDMLATIHSIDDITEREFHAMIVLAFCDVDLSSDIPDSVIESAEEMRRKMYEELQNYYRTELKLNDFSQRFGHVMTLSHNMSEACMIMNEEMRMYATMFGLYSDNALLRELFFD
ncbi:hypothetical protein PFISCL1PPCAC_13420, partial [Pristionchus fissidentatus]